MQAVVQVTGNNQSGQNRPNGEQDGGGQGGTKPQQVTVNFSKVSGDLDIDGMTVTTSEPSQFPNGATFTISG